MNYKFFKNPDGSQAEAVQRTTSEGVISIVPFTQANKDYQEYLKWLNGEHPYTEKGTPEAAD